MLSHIRKTCQVIRIKEDDGAGQANIVEAVCVVEDFIPSQLTEITARAAIFIAS